MLVGCVAGRFAAILAMATETMHSLAHRVSIVYLFFTDYLQNRIIEQTVYFILFFVVVTFENIYLFSYSSDCRVVMSSACYFLALMKLIGDSCLSKKSVWKLDFQKSPSSDFKWRGTKDDLSRLRRSRPKKARSARQEVDL